MKKKNGAHRGAMSELLSKAGEAPVKRETGAIVSEKKLNNNANVQKHPMQNHAAHKIPPMQQPTAATRMAVQRNTFMQAKRNPSKKRPFAGVGAGVLLVPVALIAVIAAVVCIVVFAGAKKVHADMILDPSTQKIALADSGADENRYDVKFTFYQKPQISCVTGETTVGNLCAVLGVVLDEDELLKMNMEQKISQDTEVNVDNVSHGTVKGTENIAYKTRYVDVKSVPKGTTRVHQKGKVGIRTIEYDVTYVNGVEMERVQTASYVTTNPTEQIVYRGVGGTVNIGGKDYSYSYCLDCDSTVYTGGGITASGLPATEAVIAVDPRVIPLGTKVYIEGVGIRTAADTGGVIKGNIVDIYFDESNPRLWGYGRRDVKVYILD